MVFSVIELLIIGGVAFCTYYLAVHPGNRTQVKMFASLLGIGSGGGIEMMRRIWRSWSQTTLLLLLLPEARLVIADPSPDEFLSKFLKQPIDDLADLGLEQDLLAGERIETSLPELIRREICCIDWEEHALDGFFWYCQRP